MKKLIVRLLWELVRRIPEFYVPGFRHINPLAHMFRRRVLGLFPGANIGCGITISSMTDFPMCLKITLGDNCTIKHGVKVGLPGGRCSTSELRIGENSLVLGGVIFDCTASIFIGKNSSIGRHSRFYTHKHDCSNKKIPVLEAPVSASPIYVGDDVRIFDEVVVLSGVKISDGAVVGTRSVVTRDVDQFSIVAGVPATAIGERQ